ncbi:MAG: ATP-dependent Clp protease ATP-binding subunit [Prevotella sp.]|nr:ATP-dependent Clp protease ATP-binding subunit [Prevotella sp.]
MNQFSPKVSEILAFSREEATRLASDSVGPEHLLLGILREKDGPVNDIFNRLHINIGNVKTALEMRIKETESGKMLNSTDLVLNDRANNILRLAVLEARVQKTKVVEVEHVLLAILHDNATNAAKEVLEINSLNYEDALTLLRSKSSPAKDSSGINDDDDDDEVAEMEPKDGASQQTKSKTAEKQQDTNTPILDNYSTDLTQAARDGSLDPVVGREKEITRVVEILGRRKKNNPILIGEPGVGKSAIVEGLAQRIADQTTSPVLFGKRLVSLDMTAVVAGTKYRGQFEERIKRLIKELEQNPDIIIFIDEIHTMVGAGSTPGSMDAANILKPALARGTIQCIGATTLDEFRNSIEKDGALERRFQKVIVDPTTADETREILHNIKERYDKHHHVTYSDEAIEAFVKLTERYINDRHFPDKAIDALDETGSKVHLQHAQIPPEITAIENEIRDVKRRKQGAVKNQKFELAANYRDKQTMLESQLAEAKQKWTNGETGARETVTELNVAEVVSMMSGIPVQRMAEAEGIRLRNMADDLKKMVIAQDNAINKMVKAIQRNRVGLRDPNHPIGAFMFLGPTGVGKTYLAKKLAEHMFGSAEALIRIDMSEYTESFNTSRLIGAPPGYVGYEEGGQLTEQVRRKPYSIVLLDEIEKAHSNVFNMLLQVLDEGRLTDGNGRLIDFRNTVIIMTSNAGTRQLKEFGRGVGFNAGAMGLAMDEKDKEYARSIIQKSLSKQFAPEFLNRLDEIITFDQLDLKAIKKIIDIELTGLHKRLADMGYTMTLSDDAKEFVATKGYDVQFGARPLKRAIQTYIEDGICEKILGGDLKQGDNITITKEGEALKFDVNVTFS